MSEPYYLRLGQYKGMPISRVPQAHLKYLIRCRDEEAGEALKELERRGTLRGNLEITAHAIDRSSQRCLGFYLETRKKNEGLYSWLTRMCEAALTFPSDRYGNHRYGRLILTFEYRGDMPVLVTVKMNEMG